MWIAFPFLVVLGMLLPGYALSRSLPRPVRFPAAFVVSLVVLVDAVILLQILGAPLRAWTIVPPLIGATIGAAGIRRRWLSEAVPAPSDEQDEGGWSRTERLLLGSTVAVGLALLARSVASPLGGPDTFFRWDFLARRMVELGSLDFYPPLRASDFRVYHHVDAIPPLVSTAYFWLYTAAGEMRASLVSAFVLAQFAAAVAFTFAAGQALFSRRAGVFAAAAVAASPLYATSVALGQESGLLGLAAAATLYFLASARVGEDRRAMVLGGFSAALCALSREYGWIALPLGLGILAWRRRRGREALLFGAVATLAALPWYLRTWVLAGNPLYSMQVMGLPTNPIYVGLLRQYASLMGIGGWRVDEWSAVLAYVAAASPLQWSAGVLGGVLHWRRIGYLVPWAAIFVALWLSSVGYTAAGPYVAARVMAPGGIALSIACSPLLDAVSAGRWRRAGVLTLLLLGQAWTVASLAFMPYEPQSLTAESWREALLTSSPVHEAEIAPEVVAALPPGSRVLSDSAYLHAALYGAGVEVVPPWSPEVSFLFAESEPPEAVERRLRALGIDAVAFYPASMNSLYLVGHSPFYRALPGRWPVRWSDGDGVVLFVPPPPGS